MVQLSYLFDDQHYHGAYGKHLWHRSKHWIILRSLCCALAIIIGGLMMIQNSRDLLAYFFVTGGSIGMLRPMIWQMWHERSMRKNPAFGTTLHFSFDATGLTLSGKQGKHHFHWNDIFELKQTNKGLLIYPSRKKYLWIPQAVLKKDSVKKIQQLQHQHKSSNPS